ncbi:MAG: MATE family efflux transporter [Owenweeksia sp.]|nr:MATE family efflux transporter [Owenweeksia sp.]
MRAYLVWSLCRHWAWLCSTTTLVGQNIGARQLKRAEKIGDLSNRIAFLGLTGIGLILFVFAEQLTAFFVPNDPQVIKDGALFIRIMAPSFGLLGVQQVMNGVFNGAGFTQASMLVSIFSLWIVRFPFGLCAFAEYRSRLPRYLVVVPNFQSIGGSSGIYLLQMGLLEKARHPKPALIIIRLVALP